MQVHGCAVPKRYFSFVLGVKSHLTQVQVKRLPSVNNSGLSPCLLAGIGSTNKPWETHMW